MKTITLFFVFFIATNLLAHQSSLHGYPKHWESGKEYAKKINNEDLTIYLDQLEKPILYIPLHDCEKQLHLHPRQVDCDGSKKRKNIAYNHPLEEPIRMVGGIDNSVFSSCPLSNLEKQTVFFSDKFDQDITPRFAWRHAWGFSNKMQDYYYKKNMGDVDSLIYIKNKLVEAAENNYFSKAPNCDFWGKQKKSEMDSVCNFEPSSLEGELTVSGWSATNQYFISGVLAMFLESHIDIIREELYSERERKLVHDWLKKIVWFIERGPSDGALQKQTKFIPVESTPNHHSIRKPLIYLLWGIADKNNEYFTAGVRAFESAYNVITKDGAILGENNPFPSKKIRRICLKEGTISAACGHNGFNSFDRANITSRYIVLMALILENQGYDIKNKFPKIEKILEFTKLSVEDPLNKKFSKIWGKYTLEEYHKWNSLRYQSDSESNVPMPDNNLGYLLLWDLYYGDNYSSVVPNTSYQKNVTEFAVFDGTCLKK